MHRGRLSFCPRSYREGLDFHDGAPKKKQNWQTVVTTICQFALPKCPEQGTHLTGQIEENPLILRVSTRLTVLEGTDVGV
jgi:hypothetical protein